MGNALGMVVMSAPVPMGGGGSSLLTGLVSYWKLDEVSDGSGDVTRNDSRGTNHLTSVNTVASTPGKVGNGALLVRANAERLTIADAAQTGLDFGTSDFAVSWWMYINSYPVAIENNVMSKGAAVATGWYIKNRDNGTLFMSFMDTTVRTTKYMAAGQSVTTWYHCILNFDRDANVTLYVNNVSKDTLAISGSALSVSNANAFYVGADSAGNNQFDGIIDEIGLWSRLLTPAEIALLYGAGNGLTYPF